MAETRRQAFVRLAEKRTNAVLDRIRILSNCSNPYAYEYDEEDIRRIFAAIEQELREARAKFNPRSAKKDFKLR
jgi:hypothetical protein